MNILHNTYVLIDCSWNAKVHHHRSMQFEFILFMSLELTFLRSILIVLYHLCLVLYMTFSHENLLSGFYSFISTICNMCVPLAETFWEDISTTKDIQRKLYSNFLKWFSSKLYNDLSSEYKQPTLSQQCQYRLIYSVHQKNWNPALQRVIHQEDQPIQNHKKISSPVLFNAWTSETIQELESRTKIYTTQVFLKKNMVIKNDNANNQQIHTIKGNSFQANLKNNEKLSKI